jgi:hypothetical protein
VVIWYGPLARLAGNRVSGLFCGSPEQPVGTYVVLGCGSVVYLPVIFGVRV